MRNWLRPKPRWRVDFEGVEQVVREELKAKISEAIDQALDEAEEEGMLEQDKFWRTAGVARVQQLLVEKGVLRPDEVKAR